MRNCQKFRPKKELKKKHPHRGRCIGCVHGTENDKKGEKCPFAIIEAERKREIKARHSEVKEVEIKVDQIEAIFEDGEAQVAVKIRLPAKRKYSNHGIVGDNEVQFLGWEPIKEPTHEEIEEARKEKIQKIKEKGGEIL